MKIVEQQNDEMKRMELIATIDNEFSLAIIQAKIKHSRVSNEMICYFSLSYTRGT